MRTKTHQAIEYAGLLDDELRRKIYFFIREKARPVSRHEAAKAAGISVKLAAFHLDKMAEKGLLDTHYQRPAGRSGPGAGRSAKYYRPSEIGFELSVPPRTYEFAAEMLVEAVESSGETALGAARRAGFNKGHAMGKQIRRSSRSLPPGKRAVSAAKKVLAENGFEPYLNDAGEIRLKNCPFHNLARQAPELVCSMNQQFISGLIQAMGAGSLEAVLAPQQGECCVKITAAR